MADSTTFLNWKSEVQCRVLPPSLPPDDEDTHYACWDTASSSSQAPPQQHLFPRQFSKPVFKQNSQFLSQHLVILHGAAFPFLSLRNGGSHELENTLSELLALPSVRTPLCPRERPPPLHSHHPPASALASPQGGGREFREFPPPAPAASPHSQVSTLSAPC